MQESQLPTKKHERHVSMPVLSYRQIASLGLSATSHHGKVEGGNEALNTLAAFLLRGR